MHRRGGGAGGAAALLKRRQARERMEEKAEELTSLRLEQAKKIASDFKVIFGM